MKKDGQISTELSNNISEIIKTFENKIILDTKEYKNLVYFQESYSLLTSNFDKNLQSEICKIRNEYKDTVNKLNTRIEELVTENAELRKQLIKDSSNNSSNNVKRKKHWLW